MSTWLYISNLILNVSYPFVLCLGRFSQYYIPIRPLNIVVVWKMRFKFLNVFWVRESSIFPGAALLWKWYIQHPLQIAFGIFSVVWFPPVWICHNKTPQMRGFAQLKSIFSQFWRLDFKVKVPLGVASGRPLFLSCGRLPSAHMCGKSILVSLPFPKVSVLSD